MIGTVSERTGEHDALYPSWEKTTIWTRFVRAAISFETYPFIITEDETYTYAETKSQADMLAQSLYGLGVRPGSRVAFMMRNCPEWVFLSLAVAKLGAVKVPVNARIGSVELALTLSASGVQYLITDRRTDDIFGDDCFRPDSVEKIVLSAHQKAVHGDVPHIPGGSGRGNVLDWNAFLKLKDTVSRDMVEALSAEHQDPDCVSDIFFTSGSTSRAKGVPLTHDMLLRSAYSTSYTRCFERGRRIYVQFPLFHVYSYVEGLLAALFMGCTVVLPVQKKDIRGHLKMIRDCRVNDLLSLASQMTRMILEGKPKPDDYPHLHAIFWGLFTPDWLWEAARNSFDVQDLGMGLGMTELCSCGVLLSPRDPFESRLQYNGTPKYAGCAAPEGSDRVIDVRICDPETGATLPPGSEGEICWKGPTVTKGYLAPAEEGTKDQFTSEGWFKSGDMGILSADGYLKFIGRMTDMYKINGENVSPAFLDNVISQCPDVRMVQCVGVLQARYGEVGCAFIHPVEDKPEIHRNIEQYCREHLADFQVPKYYYYSDSSTWPRTEGGKYSKRLLRKEAEAMIESTASYHGYLNSPCPSLHVTFSAQPHRRK